MKRIVHIVGTMGYGGLQTFIMNIYRAIDRDKVQFDFIINWRDEDDYCNEIESMGGKVFIAPRKLTHPISNYKTVKRIIKENGYQVAIRHSDNAFSVTDLLAAKNAGAKRRIFQSHSSSSNMKLLHYYFRTWMRNLPTDRFACSQNAGEWMYGKLDFSIIKNVIDIKKNCFDINVREEERLKWNLSGKKIYIHVGSYSPVKNHTYLIDVFSEIVKMQDNAMLLLVGEGELRPVLEEKIKLLHLEDRVILTGIRQDVNRLLQMADIFMFPSIYEGLPLSLIEAQAAGLRCIISDVITDEVKVTNLIIKMSIGDSPINWAKKAVELSEDYPRENTYEPISEAGYDAEKLARFYQEL